MSQPDRIRRYGPRSAGSRRRPWTKRHFRRHRQHLRRVAGRALWSTVLARCAISVARRQGSSQGGCGGQPRRGLFDDGGFEPDYTELYFERYVTLDPCTTRHFSRPSTTPYRPPTSFRAMLFSKPTSTRNGPSRFVDYIAAAIDKSMTTAVVFNVIRRHHDGMFDEAAKHRSG